jgi:hypothetical protein
MLVYPCGLTCIGHEFLQSRQYLSQPENCFQKKNAPVLIQQCTFGLYRVGYGFFPCVYLLNPDYIFIEINTSEEWFSPLPDKWHFPGLLSGYIFSYIAPGPAQTFDSSLLPYTAPVSPDKNSNRISNYRQALLAWPLNEKI